MNYWVHVLISNPGFNQVVSDLETRHKSNHPAYELSVTKNVAQTEAIIKVSADNAWMQANVNGRPWVSRVYTDADHSEIFGFIYNAEWTVAV